MSSVFLSNVDDFLAPSQACVNPMFAETTNEPTASNIRRHETSDGTTTTTTTRVLPRKRRIARQRPPASIPKTTTTTTTTPAKVSMTDCLACSGCVTTAETVLIEEHSLETLKTRVQQMFLRDDDEDRSTTVAFTLSPASWGDLFRILRVSTTTLQGDEVLRMQRRLVTFLHRTCRASLVLDGSLPLQWSLREAAEEFCRAHQEKQRLHVQTTPPPSVALSARESQVLDDGGTMVVRPSPPIPAVWPVVSSSCPALVCLVEKSTPAAVPHLCSTKSPMAAAGSYLKQHNTTNSSRNATLLHVAIMPCHDKKLEASRKDLWYDDGDTKDVDLVLSTSELWTLLQETFQSTEPSVILEKLNGMPMASLYNKRTEEDMPTNHTECVAFITTAERSRRENDMDKDGDDVHMEDAPSDDFFALGSGGYADYIFRYAAWKLFDYKLDDDPLPWVPVQSESRVKMSARVAMARKSRRDFYQVVLYRRTSDGRLSCDPQCGDDDTEHTAVLRFATAYGLQTIQRVLQPFGDAASKTHSADFPFDYMEAMACPSGCPNGGGQIRSATGGGAPRETPTETRQRVGETQRIMKSVGCGDASFATSSSIEPNGAMAPPKSLMHTSFHVVPPLQHTMGATAGVAVQDMQW